MTRQGARTPRAVAVAAGAALVLAVTAGHAAAGTRKLPPQAFRSISPGPEIERSSVVILVPALAADPSMLFAPVRIPTGARITGASFYYTAEGVSDIRAYLLSLDRASPASNFVQQGEGINSATSPVDPILEEITLTGDAAALTAEPGRIFRLFVVLSPGGGLWEARVTFAGP